MDMWIWFVMPGCAILIISVFVIEVTVDVGVLIPVLLGAALFTGLSLLQNGALGFRQFIETAEWDRLKQLSEEDPGYGMDILPYALLFNMGTKWTATFENKTIYACVDEMEKNAEQSEK